MRVRILSEAEMRRLVDMPAAIQAMRSAFTQLWDGRAEVPLRTPVDSGGVTTLLMPGFLPEPGVLGAKLVAVAPGNPEVGLPVISAVVLLADARTGEVRALLSGSWLTALRTGAASGLATDLLARDDSRVLAVFGAGVQARTQIDAVRAVRPIDEVRIVARSEASAMRLAAELPDVDARPVADAGEAARGADVVVTATDSRVPVFPDPAISEGTHVNAVGGFRTDMQELPSALLARSRVVVDQVAAALEEAGDIVIPLEAGGIAAEDLIELGALVAGAAEGRRSRSEVTVFKSVGSAAQDLAVGALALERAEVEGVGTLVEL